MIKIYYKTNCNSSQKAVSWLDKHELEIEKLSINQLEKKDIIEILSLTQEGILSIIKSSTLSSVKIKNTIRHIADMSFNDALNFICHHPYILRTPIIIEKNNLLIGYHEEEIRKFIPRDYRRLKQYR